MPEKMNLAEMASGAFMEQFDNELAKVLANIKDPNTDPKKPRRVTLTVVLKADEERELVKFEVQSKAFLAPAKPLSTTIIVDRKADGTVVGAELLSGRKGQTFLDMDGAVKTDRGENVVDLDSAKKESRG